LYSTRYNNIFLIVQRISDDKNKTFDKNGTKYECILEKCLVWGCELDCIEVFSSPRVKATHAESDWNFSVKIGACSTILLIFCRLIIVITRRRHPMFRTNYNFAN
jgi:hypothetical protein